MKYQVNKIEIVELFCDLVKINSESGEESGVASYIIKRLELLGVVTQQDNYGNLIASVAGEGKPLMLSAHMDTVKPGLNVRPIISSVKITSDGTSVLGADDKAGLAEILYMVEYLKKNNLKHRALELVFTKEEEIGLIGAKNLDYKMIKAKEALVLDHTARPGKIVLGAPYISDILIKIKGKASHASKPEYGVNAIVIAAHALAKIKIGRINTETTNNVGIIKGGLITNGVPEEVDVSVEVRSHDKQKLDGQIRLFKKGFLEAAKKYNGKVKFFSSVSSIGYAHSDKDELIKNIKKGFSVIGLPVEVGKIGGGSDANIFNLKGIKAIPLGSGGQHAHSVRETIYIKELVDMVNFLLNFVQLAKK